MSDLANPPQPRPTQAEADEFMADALGFGDDDGTPAWVPAGAKIHIDLFNNRAWNNGEVEIDTLLSSFLPENLSPGQGYIGNLDYAGDALAAVLGSFTCRIQYLWPEGVIQGILDDTFLISEGTSSYALQLSLRFPTSQARFEGYNEASLVMSSAPFNTGESADVFNTVAFTLTIVEDGGRMEFALNGSAAMSGTYDMDDRPAASFDRARTVSEALVLQSITLYDPLPTTAGLSELSEPAPTSSLDPSDNLAPTGITASWLLEPYDGTTTAAIIDGLTFPALIATLTGVDPNNDLCTIMLTDDLVGKFAHEDGGLTGRDIYLTSGLGEGAWSFTVRATDTFGAFVEQEFTLTVV